VMAVVGRDGFAGFAENQFLFAADEHLDDSAVGIFRQRVRRLHDGLVKLPNACRRAPLDRELDIRNAQGHLAECFRIRLMAAELVTPRAGDVDVAVFFGAGELRLRHLILQCREAHLESLQVGHYQADNATQHLRLARRQVELLLPDVHPHVFGAHHHVGVTGKTQAGNVKLRGRHLAGGRHVDVLHAQDVANVLRCAVECLLHGNRSPQPKQERV